MVSRLSLYKKCVDMLNNAENPDSEFDVMCIFQDILHEKNPLFRPDEPVTEYDEKSIESYIKRRSEGEPLQYILGEWDFWSYTFRVGEGVLIPRPDTETLIEAVLEICRKENIKSPKIVDLCSGSGCIAITLSKEIPQSVVYAVEKFDKAFDYLEENITLNNADVKAIKRDVLETAFIEDIDIIVSNPPYLTVEEMQDLQIEVQQEPQTALFGGKDGLEFYRKITELWKSSLKNGGYICYEYGAGQHESVANILSLNNFHNINLKKDTGGIFRTVTAKKMEDKKNG